MVPVTRPGGAVYVHTSSAWSLYDGHYKLFWLPFPRGRSRGSISRRAAVPPITSAPFAGSRPRSWRARSVAQACGGSSGRRVTRRASRSARCAGSPRRGTGSRARPRFIELVARKA